MADYDQKLFIVIVNYRTADLVVDCMRSLMLPDALPERTRVVVVDGASGDGSVHTLGAAIVDNRWQDRIELLPLSTNGGFSYGNNRGIEYLKERYGNAQYVHLLNPDTVARPGSIVKLVDFMDEHPSAGVAGSRLEDPDGSPQACAFRFPTAIAQFEGEIRFGLVTKMLDRWRVVLDTPTDAVRVDWVSGASFLIRSTLLDKIGYLDEGYFLYHEEVDFCLRAARDGWECWHVPESRVIHLVGQATGVTEREAPPRRLPAYWFESRRRYYTKNYGTTYAAMADTCWLAGNLLGRVKSAIKRERYPQPPHLLRDFVHHATSKTRQS